MKKSIIIYSIVGGVLLLVMMFIAIYNFVLYPVKYTEVIDKYATVYDLDAALIYATINVESKFDNEAVSSAGAKGLMQILPSTANEIATKLGIENFSEEMLFVADTNIRMGCFYLRYLLNLYDNNLNNAICAYNAGLSNVNLWLTNSNYSSDNQVTSPPITETKNYLNKINSNILVYNSRLK